MKRITPFVTLCLLCLALGALTGCQPINTAWTSPLILLHKGHLMGQSTVGQGSTFPVWLPIIHVPPTAPPPYFLNPAVADQPLAAYRITSESIWSPHMLDGMAAEENLVIQAGYRQTTGAFSFDAYDALEMVIDPATQERVVMFGGYLLGEQFYYAMMGHGGVIPRTDEATLQGLQGTLFTDLPLTQLIQQSNTQMQEELSDLATIRYTLTDRQRATDLLLIPGPTPGTYELDEVQFDLWVAADGGYVVKYAGTVAGRVNNPEGYDTFRWTARYEVSSINQPFVIELPPSLQAELDRQQQALATGETTYPGCPDCTFPLPPGTQLSARSMVDLIGVCPPATTLDMVMAFYQEQLPAYGWTIEQIKDQSIHVVKGDRAFTLHLELDRDSGEERISILFIPG